MPIINLENLVRYFDECENRITAVLVGENKHIEAFRQSTALNRNVQIYAVESLKNIPKVVLGEIRDRCIRPATSKPDQR